MLLIKLALRNIFRNRRRTLITISAVAGGIALFFASINLATGMYQEMVRQGVATLAGHVVVQGEGFEEKEDLEIFVPDAPAVQAELTRLFPDSIVVARTFLGGLLNSPANSVGVAVTAIQPELETRVSEWHEKVKEGSFLDDDPSGIVIGVGLAERLEVGVGDKVVLMAQGKDEVTSRLYRVKGIFRTGSADVDGFFVLIHLASVAEVLGVPDPVSQLSVHLPDPDAALVAVEVARAAGFQGVEVLDWKTALPEIWRMIQADAQGNNAFLGVMGIMVAMGVLNTILMSVMERVREFGVMLALGTPPRDLAIVILLEGLFLGIVSTVVGTVLGALLTWPMITRGIDFSQWMGENYDMSGITLSAKVFAAWDWVRMGAVCILAIVACVLAALYPAVKAARLRPVDAMHHI